MIIDCLFQIILAAVLSVALAQVPSYRYQPNQYQSYQARPRSFEGNAAILRSDAEVNDRGFHYAFETENGECEFLDNFERDVVIFFNY